MGVAFRLNPHRSVEWRLSFQRKEQGEMQSQEYRREKLPVSRLLAWLLWCAAALPLVAQSQGARLVTLPHHVVGTLSDSTRLPHTRELEQDPLRLTVVLNLSDETGRNAFEQDLQNPNSPNYRKPIGLSEFTARFWAHSTSLRCGARPPAAERIYARQGFR